MEEGDMNLPKPKMNPRKKNILLFSIIFLLINNIKYL
jgi:hypothetical protein